MKLSDWAKKQGIAYLTAYRWFQAGKLPVKAYQSDSGTIIVQDDSETLEQSMGTSQSNDVMAMFLKKTVEFSKNNSSVEDFAAYVLSNFSLKLNSISDNPKYSKIKPKSEDIQKHFQQFIKPKGEKPKPNMFVADEGAIDELVAKADVLSNQELVNEIHKVGSLETSTLNSIPESQEIFDNFPDVFSGQKFASSINSVRVYGSTTAGGMIARSDLTPQLNYTDSISPTLSSCSFSASPDASIDNSVYLSNTMPITFQPTQKEVESSLKLSEIVEKPRRGRKPSKNSEKK